MLLTVSDLGQTRWENVEFEATDTVAALKAKVEELWHLEPQRQRLRCVCGMQILEDDEATLGSCVKHEDCITVLLEAPGPILLKGSVKDDGDGDSDELRTAVTSPKLQHPVFKVEISVAQYNWNSGSSIWLTLRSPEGEVLANEKLSPAREGGDCPSFEAPKSLTFSQEDEVVSLAHAGCAYELRYCVGGGGNHAIQVKKWICRICFTSEKEPSKIIRFPGRGDVTESDSSGCTKIWGIMSSDSDF
ncbi:unnamed protein product [Effrenium voratum]|uniref:Ubiquitin-like domain-containing protein n=1 Tax=Effrenium voratum TaxID=2562239 RepID=A0AA36N8L0_9DINO|nr:unnamed protein product [Effrenium voratum]CAJ1439939.1 unnamed protein product [Effrenium voratum]